MTLDLGHLELLASDIPITLHTWVRYLTANFLFRFYISAIHLQTIVYILHIIYIVIIMYLFFKIITQCWDVHVF